MRTFFRARTQDMVASIVHLGIRKRAVPTGRLASDSWIRQVTCEFTNPRYRIYNLQSAMVYRFSRDTVKTGFMNEQAKAAYGLLDVAAPAWISVLDYRKPSCPSV